MRNLRTIRRSLVNFPSDDLQLSASAWDSDNLICAFGPSSTSSKIQVARLKESKDGYERNVIASWDLQQSEQVVSLQYFPDSRSCHVLLKGGDLVLVREEPLPGEESIEIAGTFDDGILAAEWSPDEEILAILTGSSLILMSRDLEPVADVKLSIEDHKVSNHVSVGWGKKETQFQGKRAKALRDPTMPEHIDEGTLSAVDDGSSTISWRGDGEYLAVNSIDEGKRRTIRVFSRTGTLDSVSEPVDGLEDALSWRPAGNLIAGIKRQGESAEVVFFERNGLRHGGFSLRFDQLDSTLHDRPMSLCWNSDSTVLAVGFMDRIQFWTMGNYHYYLKNTIYLDIGSKSPAGIRWSSEKPLLLTASQPGKSTHCIKTD
jgi:elongator complex protein 1